MNIAANPRLGLPRNQNKPSRRVPTDAGQIVKIFLHSPFEDGRHAGRVQKLAELGHDITDHYRLAQSGIIVPEHLRKRERTV